MEDAKKKEEKPLRQILIETDGSMIKITKSEVAGVLELRAILQTLLESITSQQNRN